MSGKTHTSHSDDVTAAGLDSAAAAEVTGTDVTVMETSQVVTAMETSKVVTDVSK